jgi:RsiW-degrading membrane proteinase PrsW (M82 family)
LHILLALLIAAAPTAVYTLLLWWLDRYEKEPLGLLFVAFIWGALPAILLALVSELILALPLGQSPIGPDVANIGIAPVIEEICKALAVVGLFIWARDEFDGPLDGIVYGALIGFGFSMTENAIYFAFTTDPGTLFWVRSVFFGANHALFTAVVGLALGLVRYHRSAVGQVAALAIGMIIAITLHALHNLLVSRFDAPGLLISWLVQSSGILVILAVALLAWRNERRWLAEGLGDEVRAGLISPAEYQTILSSGRRLRQQGHALLTGGWGRVWQVRRLHHLLTELAFRNVQARLAPGPGPRADADALRRRIAGLRAALLADGMAWGEV